MPIHLILFGVFLCIGLFFLFLDLFKLPTLASGKALASAAARNQKKVSNLDVRLAYLSARVSKHITLSEYRRARLYNILNATGITKTPEEYVAACVVKAVLVGVGAVPSLFIFPFLSPVFLVVAVLIYTKEIGKADALLKEKREKIEAQLPRFVATLHQELKNSRDVLKILEHFKHSANEEFSKELDILTADMRSGGYESALTRFEARINSPMLSDIVRGLIAVLRGDDGAVYFQMLSHDMKQLELQKLKMRAMKIPPKIRRFSFVMLLCFLFSYLVIIVFEIIRSMASMF